MLVRKGFWGLLFLGVLGCDARFNDGKKDKDKKEGAEEGSAPADEADQAVSDSQKPKLEVQSNDVIVGQWASQCLPNPGNSIQPATVIVYQFLADSSGNFKTLSYRDESCETRYTKADVDKLRARLQSEANAVGAPLTENELKEYDTLWLPKINGFSFKLGRKLSNGLIEIDMSSKNADGSEKIVYGSFYFDQGALYFSHVCSEVDAQFAACSPVAGDKPDRRSKKVNFDVAYEKQALPPPLSQPAAP